MSLRRTGARWRCTAYVVTCITGAAPGYDLRMGFLGKAMKGAVAGKVINEARKPKNQQKAKSAFSSLKSKFSGGGSAKGTKGTKGTRTKRTR